MIMRLDESLPTLRSLNKAVDKYPDEYRFVTRREIAHAWGTAAVQYNFKWMVTLETNYPLTDPYQADEIARRFVYRITKKLYSRQPVKMGIFAVVERHEAQCNNGKRKLHIHLLFEEPFGTHRKKSDYISLPTLIMNAASRITFGNRGNGTLKPPHLRSVDSTMKGIDYLLKEVLTDNLFVAVYPTNITFQKSSW